MSYKEIFNIKYKLQHKSADFFRIVDAPVGVECKKKDHNNFICVCTHTVCHCVWMNCAMPCRAGTCWWAYKVAIVLLRLYIGSVRACTGMEGAASSKFRSDNVNDTKNSGHHSDLPVLDFVPAHAFHALPYTMHTSCITYSSSYEADACFKYALVTCYHCCMPLIFER